jgi:hypothetical protein
MNQPLNSSETELLGSWINQAGSIVADDVSNRIEVLVSNTLKEVGTSADGWDVLYIDPSDGRYWELTYPNSGAHGGGAPKLSVVTVVQAKTKYGL